MVTSACRVPALPAGNWDVQVNGDYAFTLPVFEIDYTGLPPPVWCATYAEPDTCAFDDRVELVPSFPSMVCVGPSFVTRYTIALSFECPGCGELRGTCNVSLEVRPPTVHLPYIEGDLHLSTTSHWTACDVDCPPECSLRSQECLVPQLHPGSFYRVLYEGSVILSFTAGDGTESCTILDGIVPG